MLKYYVGIPVALIVLGVAYYGLSPLFINIEANDQLPGQGDDVPSVRTLASAEIVDTAAHPASGLAKIIEAEGVRHLRYENFKTINGPDLYIYLAKDLDANDFVDLGRLKATEGNVNYEIPAGVDPSEYPYALVWCKAFSVLFNSAKLY